MLEINDDLVITMSEGDIFDMTFSVDCVRLHDYDRVYITVRETLESEPLLCKLCSVIDTRNNSVRFVLTSGEMSVLPAGRYLYDLVYVKGDNMRSLIHPTRLIVREVVHNARR